MIYYGLVDKIKDKHPSGIYARKAFSEDQLLSSFKDFEKKDSSFEWLYPLLGFGLTLNPIVSILSSVVLGVKAYNHFFGSNEPELKLIKANSEAKENNLIFFDEGMDNNYSISKNTDLFYGLFDEFNNEDSVKTIMKSKGGSKLIILERDKVPSERHYGGKQGKFNSGLYCEHPKDSNTLVPLNNYRELIKTFIMEEILRIYESLGAKSILIEDRTELGANAGGTAPIKGVKVGAEGEFNKKAEILRNKQFGKGIFDIKRAESYMQFVPDFPNIMTVIESRKHGNQLSEEFTETIDLNSNIDAGVLDLFKVNMGFNYSRKWYFKVEFYDKSEIN